KTYKFTADKNQTITVVVKHHHDTSDETTTVKRPITVKNPDGTTTDLTQTVTLTGKKDTDKVTGESTTTWTPGEFGEVTIPTVPGYTPSITKIDKAPATADGQYPETTVTYTPDNQSVKIIYQDENNGDKEVPNSSQTIDGKTGETVTPTYNVPTNYDVVSGNDKTYKFTADKNQTITVVVEHHHDTSDETTTVKRPITVKNP